jgi:hypothetical protein
MLNNTYTSERLLRVCEGKLRNKEHFSQRRYVVFPKWTGTGMNEASTLFKTYGQLGKKCFTKTLTFHTNTKDGFQIISQSRHLFIHMQKASIQL